MVYVVVLDKCCEFGPPLQVFSTRELAISFVEKEQQDSLEREVKVHQGYFIFPLIVDGGDVSGEDNLLVDKNGKKEAF